MEPTLNTKRTTRWLIILVIASLFYIPVINSVTNDLGKEALVLKIVFCTIRLIGAVLLLLIIRGMIWLSRQSSSKPGQALELPADAFQVRVNLVRITVVGLILTCVVTGLAAAAYRALWMSVDGLYPFTLLLNIILLAVLHELSHLLGWIIRGIPVRTIKFGVMWHTLSPYAHCKVPTSMSAYRFALMLPLFTTGIIPLGLGLSYQDVNLTAAGALLIGGACGDLGVLFASIAFHPQSQVTDHPSEPAFIILNKGNLPAPTGQITVS
jgi:hypothetical protein